jgi:hypothetical protein
LESLKGKDLFLKTDRTIILKLILGSRVWGVKKILVAEDRHHWQALVNTVKNLVVSLS